jgi:hypothetical protein
LWIRNGSAAVTPPSLPPAITAAIAIVARRRRCRRRQQPCQQPSPHAAPHKSRSDTISKRKSAMDYDSFADTHITPTHSHRAKYVTTKG